MMNYFYSLYTPTSISSSSLLIISLIISSIVIVMIISYSSNYYKYNKTTHKSPLLNLPPGSYGWPVIGETLSLLRAGWDGKPERFIRERVEKHGGAPVFKTSLLGDSMVVFCGIGGNKFLFGNENKLVAVWWPRSVKKLFGSCLINATGEEAKWMRKILHSFLSPDAFSRLYINTMDVVTQKHIDTHWQDRSREMAMSWLLLVFTNKLSYGTLQQLIFVVYLARPR